MATLLDAGKELLRSLVRGPSEEERRLYPTPQPSSAWPDLYGEEAAQEALQDAQRALRLAEACIATGAPERPVPLGDIHRHAIAPQPTFADLTDPDQEWILVTTFGEAAPHYVRGRR